MGEYTAGAVASIAFGLSVPAVDGNVKRVLSRLMDVGDPTTTLLRDEATRLLDPERPGDFNEAMMELGATVCTPRSPRCGDCPVRPHCIADKAGTVSDRPLARRRRPLPRVAYVTAAVVRGGALAPTPPPTSTAPPPATPPAPAATLLTRRPDTGLLAGMWEFPTTEIHRHAAGAPTPTSPAPTPTPATITAAALQLLATYGLSGDPIAHPAPRQAHLQPLPRDLPPRDRALRGGACRPPRHATELSRHAPPRHIRHAWEHIRHAWEHIRHAW